MLHLSSVKKVLTILCRQGEADGTALQKAQRDFSNDPDNNKKLLQLFLDPAARAGQVDAFNQVSWLGNYSTVLTKRSEAVPLATDGRILNAVLFKESCKYVFGKFAAAKRTLFLLPRCVNTKRST